jgi:alpha-glucosidase
MTFTLSGDPVAPTQPTGQAGHAGGRCPSDWWHEAVIYQIYPRSFADSDGDGIGDLPGITSRLGYLAALGVDAIWMSPFYPSPLADGGYDISDYRNVDPRLGTLNDFDELTHEAHSLGIKVIIDVVPNHTSDQHPWFQEALRAQPGSTARDRYIFRDGTGPHGQHPPSDWRSHFGGSAWEQTPDGQWYCHLFARGQPDLNWSNKEVHQDFRDTLRFWADRGVDGFRIDVAHSLAKDLSEPLRSQPNLDSQLPVDGTDPLYDREEVHTIYEDWRRVFNEYDPPRMAVAETWTPTSKRTYLYARPTELGQVFDFSLLKAGWDRDQLRQVIQRSIDDHRDVNGSAAGGLTWVLSSHDVPRHASRLALPADVNLDRWLITDGTTPTVDPELARRRARAATLMMLGLPGSAYLYQGEELGLLEVADLPPNALRDPIWQRTRGTVKGRDGCRVPLPWTLNGPSFGFGPGGSWLPQPTDWGKYSVQAQDGVPGSSLELYRAALRLRREHPDLHESGLIWREAPEGILVYERGERFRCIVNLSGTSHPLLEQEELLLSSGPLAGHSLPPDTTVWAKVKAE